MKITKVRMMTFSDSFSKQFTINLKVKIVPNDNIGNF